MTNQLFAAALGISAPWFVQAVDFDAGQRRLTIHVDFDHIRRARNQFDGISAEEIRVSLAPANVYLNVAAIDPAQLLQLLHERGQAGR